MKTMTSLLSVAVLFTVSWLAAVPPIPSQESILNEAEKGNVAILELVRQMPVERADSMLREAERRFQSRHPEVAQAAHQLLGELPGMAEYYEKGLAELPVLIENTGQRNSWIQVPASIPKRWALELLAKLLDDKRPLTTHSDEASMQARLEQGDPSYTNAELACKFLASRYRDKIPMPPISMFKKYSKADLLKVRPWWEAHKNEPDSYFFDSERWRSKMTAFPAGVSRSPSQEQQTAPVVIAGKTTPGSPWATAFVVVTAIIAAVLLPWLLRRRKRP